MKGICEGASRASADQITERNEPPIFGCEQRAAEVQIKIS